MLLTLQAFALQGFREAIRNKILYGLGFFVLVMLAFSMLLGELALNEQERVVRNFGMTFMDLMAVALAIYLGVGMLQKEIQRKTIMTILSKPVRRYQVYLGKFLGIALTLAVELLSIFALFLLLLWLRDMPIDGTLFQALALTYCSSLIIAAAALLFSSFSSAMLATLMSISFFVVARLSESLLIYAQAEASPARRALMYAAEYLLPQLSSFDMTQAVTYRLLQTGTQMLLLFVQALLYLTILLAIGALVFEKRDFV